MGLTTSGRSCEHEHGGFAVVSLDDCAAVWKGSDIGV